MTEMTLLEAVDKRTSRRAYLPEPLSERQIRHLEGMIALYNAENDLHMQLICDDPDPFRGFRRSYGMFRGVRNYLALVGYSADPQRAEKLGYYGECLVLEATRLGLGTCWIGGTFSRDACRVALAPEETLQLVVALGPVPDERQGREKLIYRLAHGKTKSVQEICTVEGEAPAWFYQGVEALRKAPSAVNKQPVHITWRQDQATARVPDLTGFQAVDLGIGKLHFSLGAGQGSFPWGNGAFYDYR